MASVTSQSGRRTGIKFESFWKMNSECYENATSADRTEDAGFVLSLIAFRAEVVCTACRCVDAFLRVIAILNAFAFLAAVAGKFAWGTWDS